MVSNETSKTKSPSTTFSLGDHVQWKDHKGLVNFIDDRYITICIRTIPNSDPHAKRDQHTFCLLCFRESWDDVILLDAK